jgi:cobalamin biosynthesis Mg chelatase CobN
MRIFFLVIIIIMLCSCKSKEVSVATAYKEAVSSDISVFNKQTKQDTTKTKKVEQTEEFTRIYESETIVEYDTEKGIPSKVTKKEKVTEQGKQVKTDESKERGLSESEKSKVNQSEDMKMELNTNESVKEETSWSGFTKGLGKWLGIGIVVVLFGMMIWNGIKKKLFL